MCECLRALFFFSHSFVRSLCYISLNLAFGKWHLFKKQEKEATMLGWHIFFSLLVPFYSVFPFFHHHFCCNTETNILLNNWINIARAHSFIRSFVCLLLHSMLCFAHASIKIYIFANIKHNTRRVALQMRVFVTVFVVLRFHV